MPLSYTLYLKVCIIHASVEVGLENAKNKVGSAVADSIEMRTDPWPQHEVSAGHHRLLAQLIRLH